jgi:hypothetical protein
MTVDRIKGFVTLDDGRTFTFAATEVGDLMTFDVYDGATRPRAPVRRSLLSRRLNAARGARRMFTAL